MDDLNVNWDRGNEADEEEASSKTIQRDGKLEAKSDYEMNEWLVKAEHQKK